MLTTLTSAIKQQPRKAFLLDGSGAILSALLLVFLVAPLERLFGLPASVANKLAVPAFCFAIYSFGCYFLKPTPWQPWLKLIAVANLLYCCATIAILFIYRMSITPFGIAYFAGEILIVLMLLLWEWRLATTEA